MGVLQRSELQWMFQSGFALVLGHEARVDPLALRTASRPLRRWRVLI